MLGLGLIFTFALLWPVECDLDRLPGACEYSRQRVMGRRRRRRGE